MINHTFPPFQMDTKKTFKVLQLTALYSISQLHLTVLLPHRFSHQQKAQYVRSMHNRKQATFGIT